MRPVQASDQDVRLQLSTTSPLSAFSWLAKLNC